MQKKGCIFIPSEIMVTLSTKRIIPIIFHCVCAKHPRDIMDALTGHNR